MDSITILLLVLLGIAVVTVAFYLILKFTRKPKMTETDYYFQHYNTRLIYGDGSGHYASAHAKVTSLTEKTMNGKDIRFVGFTTDDGAELSFGIRGESNFMLFSEGIAGTLEYKGNTFVCFTPDGQTDPLLCDERYRQSTGV